MNPTELILKNFEKVSSIPRGSKNEAEVRQWLINWAAAYSLKSRTDAAGNLVHQAVSRGGYYEWNLNNNRGVRVASGIYFVLMTNADGTDTATAKIAVVN